LITDGGFGGIGIDVGIGSGGGCDDIVLSVGQIES